MGAAPAFGHNRNTAEDSPYEVGDCDPGDRAYRDGIVPYGFY